MMMMDERELDRTLAEYATKYPAWILVEQAAQIAQVPTGTIYDWSSRGLFDGFKSKRGKWVRLNRDAFVRFLIGGDARH